MWSMLAICNLTQTFCRWFALFISNFDACFDSASGVQIYFLVFEALPFLQATYSSFSLRAISASGRQWEWSVGPR